MIYATHLSPRIQEVGVQGDKFEFILLAVLSKNFQAIFAL